MSIKHALISGGVCGLLAVGASACYVQQHNANLHAQANQALAGIAAAVPSTVTVKPPCAGDRVVTVNGEELPCDVSPPQELAVRFPGSDGIEEAKFLAECDDMGGELVWTAVYDDAGEFVCEKVDY